MKKQKVLINAVVEADPRGGFSAFVPAMPGVISEGDTMAELENNLKDSIKGWQKVSKKIKIKDTAVQSYILPVEVYA